MRSIQEQHCSETHIPSKLYEFDVGCTDLFIRIAEASNWHQHHNSKKSTHMQHGSGAFVACLIVFCCSVSEYTCTGVEELETF